MESIQKNQNNPETSWPSPISIQRWMGFRRESPGLAAFENTDQFLIAQQSELYNALSEPEKATLGRLLKRGQLAEIEIFIRTHGANPLFDPHEQLDVPIGVAKADEVMLTREPKPETIESLLNGDVVHVLFQAGEASRFGQGPLFSLVPSKVMSAIEQTEQSAKYFDALQKEKSNVDKFVWEFLLNEPLGSRQPVMIRAALRRIVQWALKFKLFTTDEAKDRYNKALKNQKLLFFISRQGELGKIFDQSMREKNNFFGFDPSHIVTIEQEVLPGIRVDEEGNINLMENEKACDAAGHLYALNQAARAGDFTTYTESGRPIKPMEIDALAYLSQKGGRFLNIIRINDMDRHTTEIVNPRAFDYAREQFEKGYKNIIEGVGNPDGQKGGTGTTFGDPKVHVLTETHENSFPVLSRAWDVALQKYLTENAGEHPSYNAMRQWADLPATRQVLREYGGRLVFVPRRKKINEEETWYLGVDMPMGDLSLLVNAYPSRMFQFIHEHGHPLLIHDMKKQDQFSVCLRTILHQLHNSFVRDAIQELKEKTVVPFNPVGSLDNDLDYGAPTPEFNK